MKTFGKAIFFWIYATHVITILTQMVSEEFQSLQDISDQNPSEERLEPEQDDKDILIPEKKEDIIESKYDYLKWENHSVPYKISRKMPKELRLAIEEVIAFWNEEFHQCIRWTPRKTETDYVYFKHGDMCHSEVGRMVGRQLIVLDEDHCSGQREVLHEMAHAIGLTHEHNRTDRDDYIKVLFLNIPYEWRHQFFMDNQSIMEELGPYDYFSLMHYKQMSPDRAKPAFEVLKENVNASIIGLTEDFSEMDKLKVKKLYCPWMI